MPTALTVKVAGAPAVTDWFLGWLMIHGSSTVSTALELRMEPKSLVTRTAYVPASAD